MSPGIIQNCRNRTTIYGDRETESSKQVLLDAQKNLDTLKAQRKSSFYLPEE